MADSSTTHLSQKERIDDLLIQMHSDISDAEFERLRMLIYEEIDNMTFPF